jgi:hypothetical protein
VGENGHLGGTDGQLDSPIGWYVITASIDRPKQLTDRHLLDDAPIVTAAPAERPVREGEFVSLKVGMLIVAIACSVVYGYVILFEMTANPVDQLQYVMDLSGRAAAVSWVIFANIALRQRAAKEAAAARIFESVSPTPVEHDGGAVVQFGRM